MAWEKYNNHVEDLADELMKVHVFGEYTKYVDYNPLMFDQLHIDFDNAIEKMRGDMQDPLGYLNRFKIASAYVKAILKCPVFVCNITSGNISVMAKYPNEFFAFVAIESIMDDFCVHIKSDLLGEPLTFSYPKYLYNVEKTNTGFETRCVDFDEKLLKLLHYYGKRVDKFPLFAFAHYLQLLEVANDCACHALAGDYYLIPEV